MAMIDLRKAAGILFASAMLALAGCGGGGGGGGSVITGGGSGTTARTTLTVALTNQATGAVTNSVAFGAPVKVTATLIDKTNLPIANAVVAFTVPDTLLAMTPTTGTALTDATGVASILVDAASLTAAGAGTVTAKTTVGTAEITGTANFSVGPPTVTLGTMNIGQSPLSPYGTTSVSVAVGGVPATTPVSVNFTSICVGQGKATLPASVQTVNGVATATYKDSGCASTDTITASVTVGTTVTKTGTVVVQAPGVASIQFVSATPSTIVLKGTGAAGMSESSIVVFKVLDNNNQPMANANVVLDLTTRAGGILLDSAATALTKQTDTTGQVQVSVQAGTTPTPVWVTANVTSGGTTFNTQSTQLTISSGRPAQDRFSLSVGTHNLEGWNYDGETTSVNVIASDRLGNRVPDGTAINFISTGGQIQPSCTTTDGKCSVTFTTANPRPIGNTEPSLVGVNGGRVQVVAYTLGEESFTDLNGNNVYDAGEPYNDLGNVYLDANQNGSWASGEQNIVYAAGNATACTNSIGNSPSAPSQDATCDGKWGAAHVRQSQIIVMSGSGADINDVQPISGYTANRTFSMGGGCSTTISFYVFDVNRNPMPAGTTIATSTLPENVSVTVLNDKVLDTTAPGGTRHAALIKTTAGAAACGATPPVGPAPATFTVMLKVTSPKGVGTLIPLTITP